VHDAWRRSHHSHTQGVVRCSSPKLGTGPRGRMVARLPPEVAERLGAQFAVASRVLDVAVAKPELQPSCIVARIGQQMPGCVPEHVGVAVRQLCPITSRLDHLGDVGAGHRPATL
jgi:hypothetical protein